MEDVSNDIKQRAFAIMRRFKQERYLPIITPLGVTPSETDVIIAIHKAQEHGIEVVQPHLVAKFLHLTPSALSQTLKTLDAKGIIKRNRDKNDSRAVSLELTEAGQGLAAQARDTRDEHIDELIDYIGEEDVLCLIDTLERVLDFYKEQAEKGKVRRLFGDCGPPDIRGFGRHD